MNTRSQNKTKKEETPVQVGGARFRSPIGFERIEKEYVNQDTSNKRYTADDDDNDSDRNDGDVRGNSRESTPILDEPLSFLTRNSPLRSTSPETEEKIKLAHIGEEDENISEDYKHGKTKFQRRRNNSPSKQEHLPVEDNFWKYVVLCLLIPLFSIAAWVIFGFTQAQEPHEEPPQPFDVNDLPISQKDLKLDESLDKIRERFPSQDDSVWYTFGAGIKSITVEKPNKPSVFLLLYENNGETPACLANEVSKLAISYIMGKKTVPVVVDGVQLKEDRVLNEDSGELIVRYNKTVQNRGSLIVTNLHEVPGNVVKSFHFFCDSYSPLIERAAYFFTLSTQGESLPKNKLQHVAERTMRNLWSNSLKDHWLEPLITRLSGYVIRVVPESKVDGCDL